MTDASTDTVGLPVDKFPISAGTDSPPILTATVTVGLPVDRAPISTLTGSSTVATLTCTVGLPVDRFPISTGTIPPLGVADTVTVGLPAEISCLFRRIRDSPITIDRNGDGRACQWKGYLFLQVQDQAR